MSRLYQDSVSCGDTTPLVGEVPTLPVIVPLYFSHDRYESTRWAVYQGSPSSDCPFFDPMTTTLSPFWLTLWNGAVQSYPAPLTKQTLSPVSGIILVFMETEDGIGKICRNVVSLLQYYVVSTQKSYIVTVLLHSADIIQTQGDMV